jgi:AcrR family transcriptional regulator
MATRTTTRTAAEPSTGNRLSARERLLAAANDLFYDEGIHAVGIDRVIEQAGVAKASLYNTFGSKDELVRAYLQSRHVRSTERIARALQRHDAPRERLLAVFDAQAELFADPAFHGCAFANATAETRPGSNAMEAVEDYRNWMRSLLTELSEQAGAADPARLARQLHMLYDGSMQSARMDGDTGAAVAARAAAEVLLDAAASR